MVRNSAVLWFNAHTEKHPQPHLLDSETWIHLGIVTALSMHAGSIDKASQSHSLFVAYHTDENIVSQMGTVPLFFDK
jgi:hypothetical protein